MKKLQALLLTITLLLGTLTVSPQAIAAASLYGDSNNDSKINATDALFALKVSVGKQTCSDSLKKYIDVDNNQLINANDALFILRFSVGKLERFPADKGTVLVEDDTQWLNMSMDEIIDTIDGDTEATPIADAYQCHSDGGLIYNPLSRELDPSERTKYNLISKTTGTLRLNDGSVLTYSLPTNVTAYDMIPIDYTLKNGKGAEPLHVEATTFEDQNGSYYDLCLPGTVDLKFEYLGYVAAQSDGANRPYLSASCTDDLQGAQYPQYDTEELIPSDVLKQSDYVWLKFKITNIGDTILDGDGNGTFCFDPILIDSEGTENSLDFSNLYYRLTEDFYPGESIELYIYPGFLPKGEYTLKINSIVRNEEDSSEWTQKIWGGYTYGTATKTLTVTEAGDTTITNPAVYQRYLTGTRNTWLHTYEEFTTSFDSWLKPADIKSGETHTLYVQPAAWSDRVVLKFMRGNEMNMVSAAIPLKVETESIRIQLAQNADNFIVTDEGKKYPAMASQSMCDMRVNICQDPDAAAKQLDELLDMKDCGVNLVTTTEAFNIATVSHQTTAPFDAQDSNWFMCDMVRKLGMRLEGFTGYTYSSGTTMQAAYWYSRDRSYAAGVPIGYGNPILDKANGLRGLYQFMRWGNNFYVNSQGKPVFNTEDTRGWMRIDFRARIPMGQETLTAFQSWLQKKYGTIDRLNNAWGDGFSYKSFGEMDPENGTIDDHGWCNYTMGNSDFWEWSAAINDLDIFRTLERTQNYQTCLDTIKNYGLEHPESGASSVNGSMGIRTEGGNFTSVVPYNTDSSHLRHVYYSQRRCGIIPQILAKSGTVSMHSDYVTLPFSVSELEQLVASSTALGITSMPLLQANRMRDIAINNRHTDALYDGEYNMTGQNIKGAYINTQVSVFQSFKAIYENGGIPGILWEDYLCDGYVTETQQKEMKFYSQKIAEMMKSPEAQAWSVTDVPDVQAVYDLAKGGYSYQEAFLDAELVRALANR